MTNVDRTSIFVDRKREVLSRICILEDRRSKFDDSQTEPEVPIYKKLKSPNSSRSVAISADCSYTK
ncbi:hypothetical protein BSG1_07454 [Bacillus sp. SG-1]|nr:hypothetical protein BSG1_07454 [Bacillus sp. SG-1]